MAARSLTEWRTWLRKVAEETGAFTLAEIDEARLPHRAVGGGFGADAMVILKPSNATSTAKLAVVARTRLTPREGMAAISVWRAARATNPLLLCCPYISPRVAEICRTAGVNYLDRAGNCRIVARGLHVEIVGRPNLAPDTRPLGNPFSSKGSRIARVLLERPDASWQVQELAREAQVSLGLASKSKQALIDNGFVRTDDGGIQVQDPEALLRAWRAAYRQNVEPLDLYVMDDPLAVERRLRDRSAAAGLRHALAGFSAAWLLAPMVRVQRTTLLLEGTIDSPTTHELIAVAGAKRVDSGANLTLWLTSDPFLFYGSRSVEGWPVTSPLQTYLDCVGKAGRGEEAAQAIFEQLIQPSFVHAPQTA